MKVERLMTRDLETCTREANLAHAAMIMWRRNCGLVPVVERGSGQLVGVITDRDICMAAAMRDASAHSVPVGEVMTSAVVTCAPGDDVRIAMHRMGELQVRRLPVVDRHGRLEGLLSLNDLLLVAEATPGGEGIRNTDVLDVFKAVSAHPLPVGPISAP
jgi:CBS domain-containing protein